MSLDFVSGVLDGNLVEVVENAQSEGSKNGNSCADRDAQCCNIWLIFLRHIFSGTHDHGKEGADECIDADEEDDDENAVVNEDASVGGDELDGALHVIFLEPLGEKESHNQSWDEVHQTEDDEKGEA